MTEFNDRRPQQMMLPGMHHIQSIAASAPAPVDHALEKRKGRQTANRQKGFVNPSLRAENVNRTAVEQHGIPWENLRGMPKNFQHTYKEFDAFQTKRYAAMGKTQLVPRNELTTLQGSVSEDRVQQIRHNPETGIGRRTPGFIQGIDHGRGVTITNGNHRAAADLDNGALFVPVRTVPAEGGVKLASEYLDKRKAQRKKAVRKKDSRDTNMINGLIAQLEARG